MTTMPARSVIDGEPGQDDRGGNEARGTMLTRGSTSHNMRNPPEPVKPGRHRSPSERAANGK
jgi:hypothetical protein